MTLKSHILGGAAVIALACAGLVAPSIAQQQAQTDQAAPAAPAASDDATPTKAPAHRMHHNRWRHARGHSSAAERAETARLNKEQLARAQGAQQGQYGTMQQPAVEPNAQMPAPAGQPSDNMTPKSDMKAPSVDNPTAPLDSVPKPSAPSTPHQK